MKLFKKLKKGFTLIELVVVIAVIAILSAVSVVSYVAITNKAKTSADEQAVTQMNTVLLSNEVMDLRSINDVFDAFKENGIEGEDYKPLVKNRYFFWDQDENKIVYTDEDYKVLFPESMKGQRKGDHQWFSLTQTLKTVKTESITTQIDGGKSYSVATPEQFYSIGKELKDAMLGRGTVEGYTVNANKDIVGNIEFVLNEDLDLMGGSFNFNVNGNFTLNGNGHTIKGIVNNSDFITSKNAEGGEENYGTGLIGYLRAGSTATFKNVKIENCVFGSSKSKGAGALVGYSDGTINIEDVTVKNCTMTAWEHGCGGLVGDVQGNGIVTLKGNNSVSKCNLILVEGKANDGAECYGIGALIGRAVTNITTAQVYAVEGGTFTSSDITKIYGSKNVENVNPDRKTFSYWDSLTSRKTWEE